MVTQTYNDKIMTELIGLGYTTGTISDRERKRLLAKTGSNGIGKSMDDLYLMASEPNRLNPDPTIGSGPLGPPPVPPTLVIVDDGNGNLSTTDATIIDDGNGNLSTASTAVIDDGNGNLSAA